MHLALSLSSYLNCQKIISDLESVWLSEKKDDNIYRFIILILRHTSKWKVDYVIFEKTFRFLKMEFKFKRYSGKAIVPMRQTTQDWLDMIISHL